MANLSPIDCPFDAEVLILLSGGIDSMSCLNFYRDSGRIPCALFIDYGQPAAPDELSAALRIADHFSVKLHTAKWSGAKDKGTGCIPGRNAFLLTAALMECPQETAVVALGIHAGTEYEDCSLAFVEQMQVVYDTYSNGSLQVAAPFVTWSKSDVFAYAKTKNLPLELTYSCEAGGETRCGVCLSCQDRKALAAYA